MVTTNSLLRKKTRKEIKNNLPQFLAVILIAALAICLFTGLTASYKTLEKRLNLLHEKTNMLDLSLLATSITEEDYNYFLKNEYVSSVEKRLSINAYANERICNLLVTDGIPKISKPYIDDEITNGVYIDSYLAESLGLEKGDTITLSFSSIVKMYLENLDNYELISSILESYLLEGKNNFLMDDEITLDFTIKGLMMHSESCQKGTLAVSIISMDYDTLLSKYSEKVYETYDSVISEYIVEMIKANTYYNQLIYKSVNTDKLIEEIESYYFNKDVTIISLLKQEKIPANQAVLNDIEQGRKLTYVFPVIFFLVAVLVILTTTSQLIFREKMLIGSMKAIGVTKGKIIFHYAYFSMTLCLIGGVIGSIIGPLFIPSVMAAKYDLLYILPTTFNYIPYGIIIMGILLLMSLAGFVSVLVSRHEISLSPALSMKGTNAVNYKYHKSVFNKLNWSLKIAFRNIFRKKARSIMVIIGLLGCTALFLVGYGIDDTLDYTIDKEIYEYFPYDVHVIYDSDKKNAYDEMVDLGIYVEEYSKVSVKATYDSTVNTSLYILNEESKVFGLELPTNGVLLSVKTSELIGAKTGDIITIIYDNAPYSFQVISVFESSLTNGIFINESLGTLISTEKTNAWILTDSNNLDELVSNIKEIDGVQTCYSINEFKQMCDNTIGGIRIITVTLKVFAVLLAIVVLYNLAHLNFKERSRDIATMKVLGLSNAEIGRSLVFEMMILTVIGAFLGLFLGMPLLKLLLEINENEIITFIYNISMSSYVLSFIMSVLTSLVVNVILVRKTKKILMVESLKSVE